MPISANAIPITEEPLYSEVLAAIEHPEQFEYIEEWDEEISVTEYGPEKKKYIHTPDCHVYEWPFPHDPPVEA